MKRIAALVLAGLLLTACRAAAPVPTPTEIQTPTVSQPTFILYGPETPSASPRPYPGSLTVETAPAFEPTATTFHDGSGGPISPEQLAQMESQDPTVALQIAWLQEWGDWYGSRDPDIRPMTAEEAHTDIVFYKWVGTDGSIHYKAAWKFDVRYPGSILVPPEINWRDLNPPPVATSGHRIPPGQDPVIISTECLEESMLAGMFVPVGATFAVEQGTGDWVMVFNDQVVARVNNKTGYWKAVFNTEMLAEYTMAFLEKPGQFSDENLRTELYKISGQTTKINELGLVGCGGPVCEAQEILLGGKVEGNYAYFFLGTQDVNEKRFVYVGVFPLTYEGTNMNLTLRYHDALIFEGVNESEGTLSTSQQLQDFIDTHNGVVVIPNLYYQRVNPSEIADLPEEQKTRLKFAELTDARAQGILNRLFVLIDRNGYQPSDSGWGTDAGIYTAENPLTAKIIDDLHDFDPTEMVAVNWMFVRK